MTKDEYEDFALRYKGCGACFPMYHTLSRFEKMWFSAIQKDVAELEKENAELKADNDARKFAMAMSEKVEKKLREENAELKDNFKIAKDNEYEYSSLLTKAKEFIRDFLSVAIDYIDPIDKNYSLITEAEQFLKDN